MVSHFILHYYRNKVLLIFNFFENVKRDQYYKAILELSGETKYANTLKILALKTISAGLKITVII